MIKGLHAEDSEVRAESKRALTEAMKKLAASPDARSPLAATIPGDDATAVTPLVERAAASSETKPRAPGTRWIPPPQIVGPVLAVHLNGPDRVVADYQQEDAREVVLRGPLTEGNALKPGP